MGAKTGISWTEATWNPVTGCDQVSPGCDFCYAKSVAARFPNAYPNGFKVTLWPDRLTIPLRWGRGRMVFVNSMSDLFHKDVPDWFIAQVFAVMAASPRHTFQILTKRHARMQSLLTSPQVQQDVNGRWMSFEDMVRDAYITLKNGMGRFAPDDKPRGAKEILTWPKFAEFEWPLRNVWLGVSVENQKWANIRIPALQATPAAVRFLSMEPLLGPVLLCNCDGAALEVRKHPFLVNADCPLHGRSKVDWVIVGGESGPNARPMHPDWVRDIQTACSITDTPLWFKQWGEWVEVPVENAQHGDQWLLAGDRDRMWPYPWREDNPPQRGAEAGRWGKHRDILVRKVGKRDAGNLLDGQVIEQRPKVPA